MSIYDGCLLRCVKCGFVGDSENWSTDTERYPSPHPVGTHEDETADPPVTCGGDMQPCDVTGAWI